MRTSRADQALRIPWTSSSSAAGACTVAQAEVGTTSTFKRRDVCMASDDLPKLRGLPLPPTLDLPSLDDLPPLPPPTAALPPSAPPAPRMVGSPLGIRYEANTRRAQERAIAGSSIPTAPEPPGFPASDGPVRETPAKRRTGRPRGPASRPREVPSTGILDRVALGRGTTDGDSEKRRKRYQPLDDEVSAEEWQKVYEAFGETGSSAEINKLTGVARTRVNHLLDYGIMRLGLPPIREHATDLKEVNLRTNALVKASSPPGEEAFLQNLPDIKRAVTERATREAAVSQGLLHSSMRTVDVFLGYVNEVMKIVQDPDRGFLVPGKVTVAHIETLSKAANNLSRALDTAVRLSSFTAGEPEHNIALTLSHLVCQMTQDELRVYLKTRQLPKHIINPSGASLTPADEKQLPSAPRIINVDSDDDEPNG